MSSQRHSWIVSLMLFLSIGGLLVAGYQTYEHYFLTDAVCDFSNTFSCSLVTGSAFGEFPPDSGIATAGLGVIWWLVLLIGMVQQYRDKGTPELPFYLFSWLIIGLVFVIYLLVVELYILPQQHGTLSICPLCTIQHFLILLFVGLQYTLLDRPVSQHITSLLFTTEDA